MREDNKTLHVSNLLTKYANQVNESYEGFCGINQSDLTNFNQEDTKNIKVNKIFAHHTPSQNENKINDRRPMNNVLRDDS